jgi:hypothetical protein
LKWQACKKFKQIAHHFIIDLNFFVELLAHVCRKYNVGVIVDLHAAPGSQNHWEHSATRDGSLEWGTTDTSITQTVQIIDFLASRSLNRIHHNP